MYVSIDHTLSKLFPLTNSIHKKIIILISITILSHYLLIFSIYLEYIALYLNHFTWCPKIYFVEFLTTWSWSDFLAKCNSLLTLFISISLNKLKKKFKTWNCKCKRVKNSRKWLMPQLKSKSNPKEVIFIWMQGCWQSTSFNLLEHSKIES